MEHGKPALIVKLNKDLHLRRLANSKRLFCK